MAQTGIIKPNWRGKGASGPTARALSTLGRALKNIHGEGGIRIMVRGDRLVFALAKQTPKTFRCSISGLTITVAPGPVRFEQSDAVWAAGTMLIIPGVGIWYVVLEYQLAGTFAGIAALQNSEPVDDDETAREWLVRVKCEAAPYGATGLVAYIELVNHEGGLTIRSPWGSPPA